MVEFFSTPLGNRLAPKSIENTVSNLKILLKVSKVSTFKELLNENVINFVVGTLEKNQCDGGRNLKGTTLRNYLGSLKHLVSFYRSNKLKFPSYESQYLTEITDNLSHLSQGLKDKIRSEGFDQHRTVQEKMITHQDVLKYLEHKDRLETFDKVKGEVNQSRLDSTTYCHILGTIFIEISLHNANRSGEIWLMTLEQYENGEMQENGSFIIEARKHKTGSFGESYVVLKPYVLELVQHYLDKFRVKVQAPSSPDVVFLNSMGGAMKSSYVSTYMNNVWQHMGLKTQISTTNVRKFVVTTLRELPEQERNNLSIKMCHKKTTADRYYNMLDRKKVAVEIGDVMLDRLLSEGKKKTPVGLPSSSQLSSKFISNRV